LEIVTGALALLGPTLWIALVLTAGLRFRFVEPTLRAYALAIRTGRALPETPPKLPFYGPHLEHVEVDPRGNVLFWTYSDVFVDEGFVLRADGEPLPQAKLHTGSQLDGAWWTFGN
jgi:hypothetical protein